MASQMAPKKAPKQLIATLAAGFLAIVLAACGGGGGGDTGGGASATVEKPVITTQPANQSAVVGQSATFTVTATGSATLTYQWKKNGTDISGANTNTYTTPATSSADNGAIFLVSVSNSAGTVTSSSATLAVTAALVAPVITTQPVNQSAVVGQSATFSVVATNSATSSYQWKKNGTDISGAISSTYTTPATAIGDSGAVFTVVVSNAAGPVTSTEATLTVTAEAVKPSITGQPYAKPVTAGQTATFTVEATGTSPLRYQWKKNGTDIADATTSTYTTPATSLADSGTEYSVEVSNDVGTATSSVASLTVTSVPIISTQPVAKTVTAGQTATFSVTAAGTAPLRYQWKKGGTDISGATTSSYTTPATSLADSGTAYSVVVSNDVGTATSDAVILTVTMAPVITEQPTAKTVDPNATATFSVTATGTAPFSYQWQKDGTDISGATSSTYTTPAASSADNNAAFTVVVTNSHGSATSNAAILSVNVPAGIGTQPAAKSVVVGDTATFSVTATGTGPFTYQWKKGSTVLAGETSSTYTTPATVIGDNNAVFTVVVTNRLGTATSSNATLSVFASRYALVSKAVGTYTKEECVKDNTTGLIWEGKTASPATSRLGTSTYTNYDSTSSAQKADGTNPTQTEIDASTNSIGYKNEVNTSALCGFTDWRLPTKEELEGILASSGSPRIDTTWFPNTQANAYWSSSPYVGDSSGAWGVSFYGGYVYYDYRYGNYRVRLVR